MIAQHTGISEAARRRFLVREGKPFLLGDWDAALFLHFEVPADLLAERLPFPLDLWEGRAFVSLVAFTMRRMRFARLGRAGEWLCASIAAHEFLNVRTYVRHGDDVGICFLTEFLPNRLSVFFGPRVYSLPYRLAHVRYEHHEPVLRGRVEDKTGAFSYEARLAEAGFNPVESASLDEFLVERYTAFNCGHDCRATPRMFRVWHKPWQQSPARVDVIDDGLLRNHFPWWRHAQLVGGNFSPGARDVWMGAPRRLVRQNA